MSDILTIRVPADEKQSWQETAAEVGEDLSMFARKAVRERVKSIRAKKSSPWDELLGSISITAPPATSANVRKAMQSKLR